jgi:hypothetical protein
MPDCGMILGRRRAESRVFERGPGLSGHFEVKQRWPLADTIDEHPELVLWADSDRRRFGD